MFSSLAIVPAHARVPVTILRLAWGLTALLCSTASHADSLYVWTNSPHPGPPHNAWSNAAQTIQAAVDVAQPGDTVWVTNGLYASGSRTAPGDSLPNRVVVTNAITLRSVNGTAHTLIEGKGPLGSSAVRCMYMSAGTLIEFTLTNGYTRQGGGDSDDYCGAGVFAAGAVLSNCLITGNHAYKQGGGVAYGTLAGCTISDNDVAAIYSTGGGVYGVHATGCDVFGNIADSYGGGAATSVLVSCTISNNQILEAVVGRGGGLYACSATNTTIAANRSPKYGGGADGGTLTRCLVVGNVSSNYGGGAEGATLISCVLTGNTARSGGGSHAGLLIGCTNIGNTALYGGGAHGGTLSNCVITGNAATDDGGGLYAPTLAAYCVLSFNAATNDGGGVRGGQLSHCLIISNTADNGGGGWTASPSNCTITANTAFIGGGTYQGTIYNCLISNNMADYGGGSRSSWERYCTNVDNTAVFDGGGAYPAYGSTMWGGVVARNRAGRNGGGIYGNTGVAAKNCLLLDNTASNLGGAIYSGILEHCTVLGNSADTGGGIYTSAVHASILYDNTAVTDGANYFGPVLIANSCTVPLPAGSGNFTNRPGFRNAGSGDYRLVYGTRCIDAAGTNGTVTIDITGGARPLDGDYDGTNAFDVGAHEYDPAVADSDSDGMPDWWERDYALDPTNAADADAHADADDVRNLDEYLADTDPTNEASFLGLTNIVCEAGNVTVCWTGGTQAEQYLERCTNLLGSNVLWLTIYTNSPQTPVSTNFTDTAATNRAQVYRLRAVRP